MQKNSTFKKYHLQVKLILEHLVVIKSEFCQFSLRKRICMKDHAYEKYQPHEKFNNCSRILLIFEQIIVYLYKTKSYI